MLKDYFQQELYQLKELGAEFARAHPALAPMLMHPAADPDVERLLEGVAFQTAMLRRKLDDDFPEIIQDLVRIIWPHYLRPVPAATTVAFTPVSPLAGPARVPAGSTMASISVEGASCLFRTCCDVDVHQVSILDASFDHPSGQAPHVKMIMDLGTAKLKDWRVKSLRFFIAGEYAGAADMYFLLMRNLKSITMRPLEGGEPVTMPGTFLRDAGFNDNMALIPYPPHAFPGFRIIQEYFFMPEKFLYVDLCGWEQWGKRGNGSRFEIYLEFDSLPVRPPRIDKDFFRLNAAPAVNIFDDTAEPIALDHRKSWYLLRPASSAPNRVFSLEQVKGIAAGTGTEKIYAPFEHFMPDLDSSAVYHTILRQAPGRTEADLYVAFACNQLNYPPQKETISIKLKCTSGALPENLRTGDIRVNMGCVPQSLSFRNIKPITPPHSPPLGSNFLWRLVSLLSLNHLSLGRVENFRALLEFYIFPDCRDAPAVIANRKRISAIEDLADRPADILMAGSIVRGREVTMKMHRDHFISPGDMHIFGSVLDNFLGGYASINSFTRLKFRETQRGDLYEWPARLGRHQII